MLIKAPTAGDLTDYDQEHLVIYLRLLDPDAEGADWTEVARIVLQIDWSDELERARRAWEGHLARAKWMAEHGTGICFGAALRNDVRVLHSWRLPGPTSRDRPILRVSVTR